MGLKYNLGCGDTKKPGFVNVDISDKSHPDIVADLKVFPWDWMEDGAERIESDNYLEHCTPEDLIATINEAHKKMASGGILWIRVPLLKLDAEHIDGAFTDPTHRNYFTMGSFDYWDINHQRHHSFGKDYGILPWERIRNEDYPPKFLIVELMRP